MKINSLYFWLICCLALFSCNSAKYSTNNFKLELASGFKEPVSAAEPEFVTELEMQDLPFTSNNIAATVQSPLTESINGYKAINKTESRTNSVFVNKQIQNNIEPVVAKEINKSAKPVPTRILVGLGMILAGILFTAVGWGPVFGTGVVVGSILVVLGALLFFVGFFLFFTGIKNANKD